MTTDVDNHWDANGRVGVALLWVGLAGVAVGSGLGSVIGGESPADQWYVLLVVGLGAATLLAVGED